MKKISKEFWISDEDLRSIKSNKDRIDFREFVFCNRWNNAENKITISWEEPSEKYLVTMEEMSDAVFDWYSNSGVPANFNDYVSNKLKQKLFGKLNN